MILDGTMVFVEMSAVTIGIVTYFAVSRGVDRVLDGVQTT